MALRGASAADTTLVKALARTFRWRRMMEAGRYTTTNDLAAAEDINSCSVSRLLRLTLLAPDIVESILDGRQPEGTTLPGLMEPFPVEWERQRVTARSDVARSRPSAHASDAAWRARRDAGRPMAEILAMPPVRRARALATREAAARMACDPSATAIGRTTALRIVLADTLDIPLAEDWAIAHRKRERERMRARDEAGDTKRAGERKRSRDVPRSPERLAMEREKQRLRDRARRPTKAERAEREAKAREPEP